MYQLKLSPSPQKKKKKIQYFFIIALFILDTYLTAQRTIIKFHLFNYF